MKIICSETELGMIQPALDVYMRMQIGQYDNIEEYMRWNKDITQIDNVSDQVEGLLLLARDTVFPKLNHGLPGTVGLSGSYGIYSKDRPVEGGIAYDIFQEIRYRRAYFHHPEGGYTVDFRKPLWCTDDPYPNPAATIFTKENSIIAELTICPEQKTIILEALKVYSLLSEGKLREMLAHFTDEKYALDTMQCVEEIYSNISYDKQLYDKEETSNYLKLVRLVEDQ